MKHLAIILLASLSSVFSTYSQETDSRGLIIGLNLGTQRSTGGFGLDYSIGAVFETGMHGIALDAIFGKTRFIPINFTEDIPKSIIGMQLSYELSPFDVKGIVEPFFSYTLVFQTFKNAYSANPSPIETSINRTYGNYLGGGCRIMLGRFIYLKPKLSFGIHIDSESTFIDPEKTERIIEYKSGILIQFGLGFRFNPKK